MEIWLMWLDSLRMFLEFLSSTVGLGSGLAVVAATLLLRIALLPVSWSSTYGACIRQKKLRKLQPELQRLKRQFGARPQQLLEETTKLYARRGVAVFELRPFLSAIVQMPVLFGMFTVLRQGLVQARFLWIENLSKPDLLISVIAGASTALLMLANPELPEQVRILMISVPSILAFVFAMKFASALALYWVISNCFTAIQTAAADYLVRRRIRTGAISL